MNKRKPTSQRVHRDLSDEELGKLREGRPETGSARREILAEMRLRHKAWKPTRKQVDHVLSQIRSHREELGLSLSDIEKDCGLKRSALSRLENDPTANPTLFTLQRYASAAGLELNISVTKKA
ncbi:helix-turn-helix domain-containing protein [Novipirellula sp. SH528]|uniref:helix-turn-helix domain-containing protein n=1 Tax=Novipirellula sp. SH528 TaxID=3454466 RepID=UPI003FA088FB